MNDLLASAVAAHGGVDRWNRIKTIAVDAATTGAFWQIKGQGDALRMGRFPKAGEVPDVVVDHVRRCLELGEDAVPVYSSPRTAESHRAVVRTRLDVLSAV